MKSLFCQGAMEIKFSSFSFGFQKKSHSVTAKKAAATVTESYWWLSCSRAFPEALKSRVRKQKCGLERDFASLAAAEV